MSEREGKGEEEDEHGNGEGKKEDEEEEEREYIFFWVYINLSHYCLPLLMLQFTFRFSQNHTFQSWGLLSDYITEIYNQLFFSWLIFRSSTEYFLIMKYWEPYTQTDAHTHEHKGRKRDE